MPDLDWLDTVSIIVISLTLLYFPLRMLLS